MSVWQKFVGFVDVWASTRNIFSARIVILIAATPFFILQWIAPNSPSGVFVIAMLVTMLGAWAFWEWRRYVVGRELNLESDLDG